MTDAPRVIGELRELAALTSNENGAQRVAWGSEWRKAREWFAGKIADLGLACERDAAGNVWVTVPGRSTKSVIIGSHLDSVPDGGWLDGALGMMAAFEALRVHGTSPDVTLRLVDWADEEGRFGMSLLGSSAAVGALDLDAARAAVDRTGARLADALDENGLALERLPDARRHLQSLDARAYLELHIEQGPVLASLGAPLGVVIGTFGVERHLLQFAGQAAHAGSTPLDVRRDAFLAAAETALACRAIARRLVDRGTPAVCTTGAVAVYPNIPTAIPGACEMALDQRALDARTLAAMLSEARTAADACAAANQVTVSWRRLWQIDPCPFDPDLIDLCDGAIREDTGVAPPHLPSGPVHDATEMAALMPTVMMFAASPNGLSHCKEEDTPEPTLEHAVSAYVNLVGRTMAQVAGST
jgi:N-carbamoyl-L-amino-acid hydrolase